MVNQMQKEDRLNIDDIEDQLSDKESHLYTQEEPEPKINKTFEENESGLIKGWTKINMDIIPTKCMFSDPDISVHGKPATTKNIRQFTPVVEDTSYQTDEKINYILSECIKVLNPNQRMSYKDLLDIDKIFYMLAIRDMTFYKIPNPLKNLNVCNSCKEDLSIDVYSNNSTFFELSDILKKYYDSIERCFVIETDDDSYIQISPPTIGRSDAIKSYVNNKNSRGLSVDDSSIQILKYLHIDWRELSNQKIDNILIGLEGWSIDKLSKVIEIIREIKKSIKMMSHGVCGNCGAEVTAPFRFQGGFRDFFIIPNILN